jgi:RNA polymerase sigma factor (sigma-70 family)
MDDRPALAAARGMGSMATIAPPVAPTTARTVGETTDQQLVASVRAGDDRAFERLYERYHRRIAAYIYGMVNDYARAEDIAQDVFMSALRRMRETDRPIAFKPWIYEIAKNACIDQFRRARRAEEVSYDADEGLAASDYGRLVTTGPTPDVAVDQKMSLDHLCGAFGGLSETHHEILVMRELEGLSYREIGERLGMSRPSVESTLFRARRRLTEEYSELISGERCRRIQAIIATAATGALGTRDQRRMARHVSYCQPCRRQARLAGLDASVLVHTPVRARIAAFLPLPAFLRRRWGGGDSLTGVASNHAPAVAQWSSAVSDPSAAGWVKAAATAATIALAGAGAGTVVNGDDAGIAKGLAGVDALRHSGSGSHTRSSAPAGLAVGGHRRVAAGVPGAKGRHGAKHPKGSGRGVTSTSVSQAPAKPGTSGGAGVTASAPSTPATSTSPATAPSLPGTSSEPSRPSSGGTGSTSLPTLDPSGSTSTGGGLPLPSVPDVGDAGTKTGDAVDQTLTTVTNALGGG